jgi:prepilin-type N-terminal cleavage/methylation domain-containing protein
MRSTRNKTDDFSLLELLIVVAIILIIATIAVPALLRSRQSANESHAVSNLTLNTAEVQYISNNQGLYGDIPELISAGLLDFRYALPTAGYTFNVQLSPNFLDYTATAIAYGSNSGRYDYYTTPDYVLRYSTDPTHAPAGLTGEPVR